MAASARRSTRKRDLSFYLSKLEQADAPGAASLEGVHTEIALLRVLIGRVKDRPEEARRQIDALCKALRLQLLLTARSNDDLHDSLAEALDEIAVQLENEP